MVGIKYFNKEDLGKKLIPNKIYKMNYREKLEDLYEKLYYDNLHFNVISNLFALSCVLSLIAFFLLYSYLYAFFVDYFYSFVYRFLIIFVFWLVLNTVIFYGCCLAYFFVHEAKFRNAESDIEKDLPEFIDNLVSNLKGGISLEKALVKSVRPEQKALMAEVSLINQKVMMGKNVNDALKEFRLRFDSQVLNRTVFLMEEGIRSGGNLAAPLERISENLKRIYNLDAEIKANAGGFSVVIKAIAIFVAPLLFSLALTLLTFIGNLFLLMSQSGSTMAELFREIPAEFTDYLVVFSYAMIALITFFSSLITAELKNEKIYESFKYLPFYVILSVLIFKLASKVLLTFFGSVI